MHTDTPKCSIYKVSIENLFPVIPGDSPGLLISSERRRMYSTRSLTCSVENEFTRYDLSSLVDLHILSSVDSCSPVALISCKCLLF